VFGVCSRARPTRRSFRPRPVTRGLIIAGRAPVAALRLRHDDVARER
jgi:hypothetical protein